MYNDFVISLFSELSVKLLVCNHCIVHAISQLWIAPMKEMLVPIASPDLERELRGKPLGCYCRLDQSCHAGVLLRIAISEQEQDGEEAC